MPLTILDGFGSDLFAGITAVHMDGAQMDLLDSRGESLIVSHGAVAPAVTAQPTIRPVAPLIGESITLTLGTASGSPAPVADWDLTLDGVSIRNRLDQGELTMEITSPGVYALSVRWTNSAGTATATSTGFTVVAAPVPVINYDLQTLAYIDAETTFGGTATDVASVTARGTGRYVFAKTGTGAAIQRGTTGFTFADGAYLQSQTLSNQPTTDGLFAVADVTLTRYGSNSGQVVDGTGGHVKIRDVSGSLQITGTDDTAVNLTLGSTGYGRRMVIAAQIDDLLDILSGHDVSGNVVSTPHGGMTDPALSRVISGRYLVGTLHRLAIVGRTEGQPWPITMREVVEDFRRGA